MNIGIFVSSFFEWKMESSISTHDCWQCRLLDTSSELEVSNPTCQDVAIDLVYMKTCVDIV